MASQETNTAPEATKEADPSAPTSPPETPLSPTASSTASSKSQHAKAISIGNAASLFGGGGNEDSSLDFFSALGPSSGPTGVASNGATPFETLKEESEDEAEAPVVGGATDVHQGGVAADLFGGNQDDGQDWLGQTQHQQHQQVDPSQSSYQPGDYSNSMYADPNNTYGPTAEYYDQSQHASGYGREGGQAVANGLHGSGYQYDQQPAGQIEGHNQQYEGSQNGYYDQSGYYGQDQAANQYDPNAAAYDPNSNSQYPATNQYEHSGTDAQAGYGSAQNVPSTQGGYAYDTTTYGYQNDQYGQYPQQQQQSQEEQQQQAYGQYDYGTQSAEQQGAYGGYGVNGQYGATGGGADVYAQPQQPQQWPGYDSTSNDASNNSYQTSWNDPSSYQSPTQAESKGYDPYAPPQVTYPRSASTGPSLQNLDTSTANNPYAPPKAAASAYAPPLSARTSSFTRSSTVPPPSSFADSRPSASNVPPPPPISVGRATPGVPPPPKSARLPSQALPPPPPPSSRARPTSVVPVTSTPLEPVVPEEVAEGVVEGAPAEEQRLEGAGSADMLDDVVAAGIVVSAPPLASASAPPPAVILSAEDGSQHAVVGEESKVSMGDDLADTLASTSISDVQEYSQEEVVHGPTPPEVNVTAPSPDIEGNFIATPMGDAAGVDEPTMATGIDVLKDLEGESELADADDGTPKLAPPLDDAAAEGGAAFTEGYGDGGFYPGYGAGYGTESSYNHGYTMDSSQIFEGATPEDGGFRAPTATEEPQQYGQDWSTPSYGNYYPYDQGGGDETANPVHDRGVSYDSALSQELNAEPASYGYTPGQPDAVESGSTSAYDPHSATSPLTSGRFQQPQPHDPYAASAYTPYSAQQQKPPTLPSLRSARSYTYDQYPADDRPQMAQPLRPGSVDSYAYSQANDAAVSPYAAQSPYAPTQRGFGASTSRLPSQDLLGTSRVCPIVSFGFGGRLVTFFPNPQSSSSYNPLSDPYSSANGTSNDPSAVQIRKIVDLAPEHDLTAFPGPVFMDGGSKASAGKKRKEVVTWLDERITDLQKGAGFVMSAQSGLDSGVEQGSAREDKKREIEEEVVLLKLVKVLVENEGRLSGTAKLDEAIRNILVDTIPSTPGDATRFSYAGEQQRPGANGTGAPVATYTVTSSDIEEIQRLLVHGERRQAIKVALDRKMWGHAFVVASNLDKDSWEEVVKEFIRTELGSAGSGKESVKVAYSLFAGLGAQAINEFLPQRSLAPSATAPPAGFPSSLSPNPLLPSERTATPVSPNFPDLSQARNTPASTLSQWRETAATVMANHVAGDSATMTALGDTLSMNHWTKAAHACYLLSPGTSLLGGVGAPSARITLIGADSSQTSTALLRDGVATALTELVEFALSLTPVTKGQEPYIGIAHLQAFRLAQAWRLSDAGLLAHSQRYCDAITGTLKLAAKGSPYYHPAFLAQVKELSDRLNAASHDKGPSWRKLQRPTLDSLWSTLEGRFTKFVAGEGEEVKDGLAGQPDVAKSSLGQPIGPFSHYSTISPASTGPPSRAQSQLDLRSTAPSPPVAMAVAPPPAPSSSSAPKRSGPIANHQRVTSYGFSAYGYNPYGSSNTAVPEVSDGMDETTDDVNDQTPNAYDPQYGQHPAQDQYGSETATTESTSSGWWGAAGGVDQDYSSSNRTPVFAAVNETFAEDASGFISPMGTLTPQPSQTSFRQNSGYRTAMASVDEDADDLGLGNSKRKSRLSMDTTRMHETDHRDTDPTESTDTKVQDATAKAGEKPALKTATSSSWLGRLFRKDSNSPGPGPVRANLGEETSFVYDPVQKRWVNKKAGSDDAPPAVPPPPPRAATASPTSSGRTAPPARFMSATPPSGPPPPTSTLSPPPPQLNRSQTVADLQSGGTIGPPPPGRRAASTGVPITKKPIRARYVDVMGAPGGS